MEVIEWLHKMLKICTIVVTITIINLNSIVINIKLSTILRYSITVYLKI